MYPLKIQGHLVHVREFERADTDAVLEILGDERVTHSLSFDSRNRDQVESMLDGVIERARNEPRSEFYMAIDAPALVGFVRLGLGGTNSAKIGYAIHADEWQNGYATEAISLMIAFGFDSMGLRRISAAIGPDNEASIALVEKLGFVYEGRLRDHVFTNGAWRDSLLFSILAHEWSTQP